MPEQNFRRFVPAPGAGGLVQMLRGRLLRGMSLECFGAALLGLATLVGAIFINLYTYDRLTREQTLADGARYRVQLGTSGLLARPLNQEAKGAVAEWR